MIAKINRTKTNREEWRDFARPALADYTPLMGWLLVSDGGDLSSIWEPQGQNEIRTSDGWRVVATYGDVHSAHGQGGKYEVDADGHETYVRIRTQKRYFEILGLEWAPKKES